eukprot:TRINITY_DN5981_c0_g2_i3.p1 TRINITY_DN5981_c0_g2~~TRINITY_DN5981_c0_g2_i3.p1  ORF type:complete len:339 (-),score=62.05 TRINITY_DN5981_c0_g2_i3:326-1342(-)
MMRQWRNQPIFGLMENKLLASSLLEEFGVPQCDVRYGAFAHHSLGKWPIYKRSEFKEALKEKLSSKRDPYHFVVKSATSGMGKNVLIMTPKRWHDNRWRPDVVVSYVEKFMYKESWWSDWGQKYEHLGVVMQDFFADDKEQCKQPEPMYEIKAHVVLGKFSRGRVAQIGNKKWPVLHLLYAPSRSNEYKLKIATRRKGKYKQTVDHWKDYLKPRLERYAVTERMADIAGKITGALKADYWRLDVFWSPCSGEIAVNEITYPSHMVFASSGRAFKELETMYKTQAYKTVPGDRILDRLLKALRIDKQVFLESPDYLKMKHAADEEYERTGGVVKRPAKR